MRIAIDFGTTNSVIALWDEKTDSAQPLALPGITLSDSMVPVPLIPSRIRVITGDGRQVMIGAEAEEGGVSERLFRAFKRGIGGESHVFPRVIDGEEWDDRRAASAYLGELVKAIKAAMVEPIDELVLTVPVISFEGYLKWLKDEIHAIAPELRRVRVVDECTAAALGYNYRQPGELVLVFDFGGGTLDVSLVRMPTAGESGGILLGEGATDIPAHAVEARVIAKSGRILGGDDVDTYLFEEVMKKADIQSPLSGDQSEVMRAAVETAKITLSKSERTKIVLPEEITSSTSEIPISRVEMEDLLERAGIPSLIRRTVENTLRTARQVGIFPEDIGAVLLVGGSSLIPLVRDTIRAYFSEDVIHSYKTFEAVACGALELSGRLGVNDFIYHSYAIRVLDPLTGGHQWEEIIPAGTRYPREEPLSLILAASRDKQSAIELVLGEVEEEASTLTEVVIGGRTIHVVGSGEVRRIIALNDSDGARTMATLDPVAKAGEDRLEVSFTIDRDRFLRVSVRDLQTRKILLSQKKVIELH